MKQYSGIILSLIYALTIRILAEFNVMEVNSLSFLIITPMLLGFVPFMFTQRSFLDSTLKVIIFPLISVLLFLVVAVISRLEDLACFVIIGLPYIVFSILVSLLLKTLLKNKNEGISKNALPIFLLPVLLGMIEKQVPKKKVELHVSNEIVINCNKENVWNNLLSVPDLTNKLSSSFYNHLGIPRPIKSTYNPATNSRLGYFENEIILHESVVQQVEYEKLVFEIHPDRSKLANSPTLKHILKNKNVEINSITYEISSAGKSASRLKLSAKITVNSNLSFYGIFWSRLIIEDFESNLLKALKKAIEGKDSLEISHLSNY